jgi:hypothetical protein
MYAASTDGAQRMAVKATVTTAILPFSRRLGRHARGATEPQGTHRLKRKLQLLETKKF